MIGIETDLEVNLNAEDVRQAHFNRLEDAATKGFSVALERAPEDRGTLKQGMFPPERRGNSIVYGATAPYSASMEFGTNPGHTPPPGPILEWAQRVASDPGLGYYVAKEKIPTEGIDAQPFARPGKEEQERWYSSHDVDSYIQDNL